MLSGTILISFAGALACGCLPRLSANAYRGIALTAAALGLTFALFAYLELLLQANLPPAIQLPWITALGIEFHLRADGISLILVLLTGIASVTGILFSWNIRHRVREFFAFYLTLIGAMYGVFLSYDLFLFLVFFELAIFPKYFLIAIWGSTRKEYGAMKLALYSFVGSALVLIGLLATWLAAGASTFNLLQLSEFSFSPEFQYWAFPITFIGFAVLGGLWPLHSWAPTGHVAAPTGASMLLAGVVMKLGAYGCLRFPMTLFPQGLESWRFEIAALAIVGIIYGGGAAMVQRDFKYVIGYSSVSHMGFVFLGLMTLTEIGLAGAVLQMFSHGILASLLFGIVGRIVYDRVGTRDLKELENWQLAQRFSFAAAVFVIAGFANMGMPGFSAFIAELHVLIGAWQSFPSFAVLGGFGILVGAAYTVRAMVRAFFTERKPYVPVPAKPIAPLTLPERIGTYLLIAVTVVVGLFPDLLLNLIVPGIEPFVAAPPQTPGG